MQTDFPAELERYLRDAVASGAFASREELLADAIRLHRDRAERLRALRHDLQVGIDELDRGEGHTLRTAAERQAFFEKIERDAREKRGESVAP